MSVDQKYLVVDLMPVSLNRNKSQQTLKPSEARILQSVDVLWMDGRARRGAGYARTNLPTESETILNALAITRQDCNMAVLYHTGANNSIKVCWGDGAYPCRGPVPFWQDNPTPTQFNNNGGTGQNYDEERLIDVTSDY